METPDPGGGGGEGGGSPDVFPAQVTVLFSGRVFLWRSGERVKLQQNEMRE